MKQFPATAKLAERLLSPGSLVLVTQSGNKPYLFPEIVTESDGTHITGEAFQFHNDEPCFVVSTIVDMQSIFTYVMNRDAFGWLMTWETDGVVELVEEVND